MRPNVQAALRGFKGTGLPDWARLGGKSGPIWQPCKGSVRSDALLPGPLRHGPRCPREQSAVLVCGIDRDQEDQCVARLDPISPPNLATLAAGLPDWAGNRVQSGNTEEDYRRHDPRYLNYIGQLSKPIFTHASRIPMDWFYARFVLHASRPVSTPRGVKASSDRSLSSFLSVILLEIPSDRPILSRMETGDAI